MVLNRYREKVDSIIAKPAKALSKLDPDAVSVLSLLFALIGAIFLILWNDSLVLIVAFAFILLNGLFDAMDGYIARITDRQSKRGDLVDHVIDRYADFIILAGISLSAFADVGIGLIALGSIMIVSYMGTQSQALGMDRDYGGILGRAERLVLILLFLLIQFVLIALNYGSFEITESISLTLLDLLLIIFILGANITILQRFSRMWRALS